MEKMPSESRILRKIHYHSEVALWIGCNFGFKFTSPAGAFGKVTNLQEGVRATWSRIRKEAGGGGPVADMQDG
jgi:hypothetical protein